MDIRGGAGFYKNYRRCPEGKERNQGDGPGEGNAVPKERQGGGVDSRTRGNKGLPEKTRIPRQNRWGKGGGKRKRQSGDIFWGTCIKKNKQEEGRGNCTKKPKSGTKIFRNVMEAGPIFTLGEGGNKPSRLFNRAGKKTWGNKEKKKPIH